MLIEHFTCGNVLNPDVAVEFVPKGRYIDPLVREGEDCVVITGECDRLVFSPIEARTLVDRILSVLLRSEGV